MRLRVDSEEHDRIKCKYPRQITNLDLVDAMLLNLIASYDSLNKEWHVFDVTRKLSGSMQGLHASNGIPTESYSIIEEEFRVDYASILMAVWHCMYECATWYSGVINDDDTRHTSDFHPTQVKQTITELIAGTITIENVLPVMKARVIELYNKPYKPRADGTFADGSLASQKNNINYPAIQQHFVDYLMKYAPTIKIQTMFNHEDVTNLFDDLALYNELITRFINELDLFEISSKWN